jgi:lipid-A-disaccharide synthase
VRLFISTGEVSGDLQGALLVQSLRRQTAALGIDLEILALGGDRMAAAGATLLGNTTAIGSIGLFESLPYVLPTYWAQQRAKRHLRAYPPDGVVMIDYLAPNVTIGRFLQQHLPAVPITYYIAPQEWVWSFGSANTRRLVAMTDQMLAVFPEEARYYARHGATVQYVGHPLVDQAQSFPSRAQARTDLGIREDAVAIALLPASRRQELTYILPVMCQAAAQIQYKLPQAHFWISLSMEAFRQPIEAAIRQYGLRATLVSGRSPTVIAASDLAITKSGTVNLEIALMDVPQVVVYRVSPLTAWVARHLLKFSIPFMSPVNLLVMRGIVPEFLQERATPSAITQVAMELLLSAERRQHLQHDYQDLRQAMGEPGVCDRAAAAILDSMIHSSNSALSS